MDSGKHFKPTLPTAQQVLEDLSNLNKESDFKLEDNINITISEKAQSGFNCFKNLNNLKDNLSTLNQLTNDLEHLQQVLDKATKPRGT